MSVPAETSTKDIILDAAEKAFADLGFAGASLRQIVTGTSVNIATVYYHFGSKEGLLDAVLDRRLGPLKAKQLECVRQLLAAPEPPSVERLLHAMLSFPLSIAVPGSEERAMAKRVLGRMINDPTPETQERLCARHAEVRAMFFEAFHRSLPELPAKDLCMRLEFIWGALALIMCNPLWMGQHRPGIKMCVLDVDEVLAQMIAFFASGLRAPSPSKNQISQ
jgi:AcrR family transcriptional regulator